MIRSYTEPLDHRVDNTGMATDPDCLAVVGQVFEEKQSCLLCDGPAPWEDLCGECQTLREVLIDSFFTHLRR